MVPPLDAVFTGTLSGLALLGKMQLDSGIVKRYIVKQSRLRCARPFPSLHLAVEDHGHPNPSGPPSLPQTQYMSAIFLPSPSFQISNIGRSNRPILLKT